MKKSDFYFDLPEELIAQTPIAERDHSRLLHVDKTTGALEHRHFYDLPDYLREGDCLVLNDSRVLPARLIGARPTGGTVELVLLRDLGEGRWECLSRPGRKTKPGQELVFGDGELSATVEAVTEGGNRIVRFRYEGIFLEVLERQRGRAHRGAAFYEGAARADRGEGRQDLHGDAARRPRHLPPGQGG